MSRVVRAELIRLVRRRTVAVALAVAAAFSVVATLAVFASALPSGDVLRRGGTTLDALAGDGGGTEAFATGASFVGFLVFVTFIALVAGEFSGGTFRALLLRHPHRLRLVAGKFVAALLVAGGVAAVTEVCVLAVSLAAAPANDVPTGAWFSLASLGAALRDYATVMAGVTGWALFGTALGVAFRSTPVALGAGFAWAGPFENIVVESWEPGYRYFPGQVLGSLIRGGTVEAGMGRAVVTTALYAALALVVTLVLVSRRDVTA